MCSKALDTIKPADIKLVQSFKNPPAAIKLVMEAVCVLLDIKPAKVPDPSGSGKKIEDYWEPSKKALGDPNFVTSLKGYDKDNIPPKIIETIRSVYTCNPDFTPATAAKASAAAEGLCKWVCAMERYEEVAKVVAPKQAALAVAEGEYAEVMAALTVKQVRFRPILFASSRRLPLSGALCCRRGRPFGGRWCEVRACTPAVTQSRRHCLRTKKLDRKKYC